MYLDHSRAFECFQALQCHADHVDIFYMKETNAIFSTSSLSTAHLVARSIRHRLRGIVSKLVGNQIPKRRRPINPWTQSR